jgi:branched-chain amino acid transport system permease protein
VIIGGMGSIPGVVMGAIVLKGLPEVLRELDDYRMLAFGTLLIVMMILRPEGLWPSERVRMELSAKSKQPDEASPALEGGQ